MLFKIYIVILSFIMFFPQLAHVTPSDSYSSESIGGVFYLKDRYILTLVVKNIEGENDPGTYYSWEVYDLVKKENIDWNNYEPLKFNNRDIILPGKSLDIGKLYEITGDRSSNLVFALTEYDLKADQINNLELKFNQDKRVILSLTTEMTQLSVTIGILTFKSDEYLPKKNRVFGKTMELQIDKSIGIFSETSVRDTPAVHCIDVVNLYYSANVLSGGGYYFLRNTIVLNESSDCGAFYRGEWSGGIDVSYFNLTDKMADLFNKMGYEYYKVKDYNGAFINYKKAYVLRPMHPVASLNAAGVLSLLDRYADSYELISKSWKVWKSLGKTRKQFYDKLTSDPDFIKMTNYPQYLGYLDGLKE